uniref:WAPL domain-containing protein n=1 Tax=Panagrellus redivivus TaxID=6233 RepID=A0A7E4VRM7_PANRE
MPFWRRKPDKDPRAGNQQASRDQPTPPMRKANAVLVEKSKKGKGKKSKMQKGLAAISRPVNKLKAVTKNAKSVSLEAANSPRVKVEKPFQSVTLPPTQERPKQAKPKTTTSTVSGVKTAVNQTQTLDRIKKAVAEQQEKQEEAKAKASAAAQKKRSGSCENVSMTAMTSEKSAVSTVKLDKHGKSVKTRKAESNPKKKIIAETQAKVDALRKANNDRENRLFRRLATITDDDCGLPELKQRVGLLRSMVKRTGYGMQDQTDLFIGCLNKSTEYLNIITQYRRMQSHKMTLLLDHADEECKRTNQLLEEHFQNLDCVYQLMRPDASSLELLGAVFRRWSRKKAVQA